eukprot:8558082-Pyramimonas_sp.AAC.1
MQCLRTGFRRQDVLDSIEEELNKTPDAEWRDLLGRPTPDRAWKQYGDAVRNATHRIFGPQQRCEDPCYTALKQQRMELLERRRNTRQLLGPDISDETLETVKAQLKEVTSVLKQLREGYEKQRKHKL